ncbi:hypothetical protein BJY00DRAFT_319621 [Aspergillus carlsbadensis]|nr:hypothetical protein BJY00DRAFT_319621 [Aspergillus carlsbadensis]
MELPANSWKQLQHLTSLVPPSRLPDAAANADDVLQSAEAQDDPRRSALLQLTRIPGEASNEQILLENLPPLIKRTAFECVEPGCQERFKKGNQLMRHMRSHMAEKPYACWVPECDWAFSRKDNLRNHTKTHGKRGGRYRYVATCDANSPDYDPEFRGKLTPDGRPIRKADDETSRGSDGSQANGQQSGDIMAEIQEALSFIGKVKARFSESPSVYREFLDILKAYEHKKMTVTQVNEDLTRLFVDAPDLLKGLQVFMPETERPAAVSSQIDDEDNRSIARSPAPSPSISAIPVPAEQESAMGQAGQHDNGGSGQDVVSANPITSSFMLPPSKGTDRTAQIDANAVESRGPFPTVLPRTTAVTDSGYSSIGTRKPTLRLSRSITQSDQPRDDIDVLTEAQALDALSKCNFDQSHVSGEVEDDDTMSIYSELSNLGTPVMDGYVAALAKELARTVLLHGPSQDDAQQLCESLPKMLTALFLTIGTQNASRINWEVMVFIHKHRR